MKYLHCILKFTVRLRNIAVHFYLLQSFQVQFLGTGIFKFRIMSLICTLFRYKCNKPRNLHTEYMAFLYLESRSSHKYHLSFIHSYPFKSIIYGIITPCTAPLYYRLLALKILQTNMLVSLKTVPPSNHHVVI